MVAALLWHPRRCQGVRLVGENSWFGGLLSTRTAARWWHDDSSFIPAISTIELALWAKSSVAGCLLDRGGSRIHGGNHERLGVAAQRAFEHGVAVEDGLWPHARRLCVATDQ